MIMPHYPPTFQEGLHGSAVGHVNCSSTRVQGERGVGAPGQKKTYHLHMVVLYSIVKRPGTELILYQ